MIRKINRLNEEIARWAFEILFETNHNWAISFTNPTAGPWKTIKASSITNGKVGEVYRFILEEDRPDIIMYNDTLKVVIIFEAKDSLDKLLETSQSKKSADVVVKLASILSKKKSNEFWTGREDYKIILGLLWGSTDVAESNYQKDSLFDLYQSLVCDKDKVFSNIVIGVETLYKNNNLSCSFFAKSYDENNENLKNQIVESLAKEKIPI